MLWCCSGINHISCVPSQSVHILLQYNLYTPQHQTKPSLRVFGCLVHLLNATSALCESTYRSMCAALASPWLTPVPETTLPLQLHVHSGKLFSRTKRFFVMIAQVSSQLPGMAFLSLHIRMCKCMRSFSATRPILDCTRSQRPTSIRHTHTLSRPRGQVLTHARTQGQ